MRFLHSTGRLGARQLAWYSLTDPRERASCSWKRAALYMLKRFYEPMVGWSKLHGTLQVRFEDLTGDSKRAAGVIESVAAFLGVQTCDAHGVLRASLQSETITKSDGVTRLDDYWSPEAERRFLEIGGVELNARLGCSAVGSPAASDPCSRRAA